MFRCQLCLCNRYKNKPTTLDEKLSGAVTVADAINLNFAFIDVNIDENKIFKIICLYKIKTLKLSS